MCSGHEDLPFFAEYQCHDFYVPYVDEVAPGLVSKRTSFFSSPLPPAHTQCSFFSCQWSTEEPSWLICFHAFTTRTWTTFDEQEMWVFAPFANICFCKCGLVDNILNVTFHNCCDLLYGSDYTRLLTGSFFKVTLRFFLTCPCLWTLSYLSFSRIANSFKELPPPEPLCLWVYIFH